MLFGRPMQQERYENPEVQGGKIALIVDKTNNLVQQPPNSLDRMHASLPKQVAYNQRVLRAGQETDGINCDIADFLSQMELAPDVPVIVCVNASGSIIRKHEQHVGGQLWMQGDRQMTAINLVPPEMKNEEKSATLIAVAEAVERKHAFEPVGPKRLGQRVVIYPPFLDNLEQVLNSGDPSCYSEPSHSMAYQRIYEA
jgi:hypothetical protein